VHTRALCAYRAHAPPLPHAQPDVVAFQDVLTGEAGQDAAILAALRIGDEQAAAPYAIFACRTAMSHLQRLCVAAAAVVVPASGVRA
jgi:hypothetical protein